LSTSCRILQDLLSLFQLSGHLSGVGESCVVAGRLKALLLKRVMHGAGHKDGEIGLGRGETGVAGSGAYIDAGGVRGSGRLNHIGPDVCSGEGEHVFERCGLGFAPVQRLAGWIAKRSLRTVETTEQWS